MALESVFENNPAPFENNLKDVRFTDVGGLLVRGDDGRRGIGTGGRSEAGEKETTGKEAEGKEAEVEEVGGKDPAEPTAVAVTSSPDQGVPKDV